MAQEVGHAFIEAIGSRGAKGQQVTRNQLRQRRLAEAIEARAERPRQGVWLCAFALAHGFHREGFTREQGADQVVDAPFQDGEPLTATLLDAHHAGQVDPAGACQEAARF